MKYLIIIPFGLPWNWSAADEQLTTKYLSKKSLVLTFLILEGVSVRHLFTKHDQLFSNPFHNIYIFRPIYILPFQRYSLIKSANYFLACLQLRVLVRILPTFNHKRKIYWTSSLQYLVLPHNIGRADLSIYHCVDMPFNGKNVDETANTFENQLLRETSIVFTNTKTLYDEKKLLHKRVCLVPVGFDAETIIHKPLSHSINVFNNIPHPQIHFVGNINNRIDFPFLYSLIKETPQYSYVFIGKVDPNYHIPNDKFDENLALIKTLDNTYFLGFTPKKLLFSYLHQADITLIPYDISQMFNKYCYPVKTLEYFYVGKPVISTPISEMTKLSPYVSIVNSSQNAKKVIKKILSKPWPRSYQLSQRQIAVSNSWENKINAIRKILKQEFDISI